jgi:hypothetical protein
MYHVLYEDGDEELCSRGKIRVPEWKEKQPGILLEGQVVYAQCLEAGEMVLRGTILAGPFREGGPKEGVDEVGDPVVIGLGLGLGSIFMLPYYSNHKPT